MPLQDGSEDAAQVLDDDEREEGEERPWEAPSAAADAAGTATPDATAIDPDELRALGAQADELVELLLNTSNGHTQLSR